MDRLPENRALLDAFRRADPAALEGLYRSYAPELACFLRRGFEFSSQGRQLRFAGYEDPEQLRDALQDVFLRGFSAAARKGYDGLRPFGQYLRGIARNAVLARFRKDLDRISRFQDITAAGAEPACDAESIQAAGGVTLAAGQPTPPDEAAEQQRIRTFLRAFVAGLSEEQRQVVRLHFVEQLGQRDTAAALGLDRNRVRKHIRLIRRSLWRQLKRHGLERALPLRFDRLEVR